MCVCVCVYIYMCVCVCVCSCDRVCICMCVCVHTRVCPLFLCEVVAAGSPVGGGQPATEAAGDRWQDGSGHALLRDWLILSTLSAYSLHSRRLGSSRDPDAETRQTPY